MSKFPDICRPFQCFYINPYIQFYKLASSRYSMPEKQSTPKCRSKSAIASISNNHTRTPPSFFPLSPHPINRPPPNPHMPLPTRRNNAPLLKPHPAKRMLIHNLTHHRRQFRRHGPRLHRMLHQLILIPFLRRQTARTPHAIRRHRRRRRFRPRMLLLAKSPCRGWWRADLRGHAGPVADGCCFRAPQHPDVEVPE